MNGSFSWQAEHLKPHAAVPSFFTDSIMGFGREVSTKKYRSFNTPDTPAWLVQAEELPNRLFITPTEKELIDLIRLYGELTKANLVVGTDHSRTKITSSIDSLLQKNFIIENDNSEYSGGRRSRTFSLNGDLGYVAGVDIGATSIDLAIANFGQKILARAAEELFVREGPIKVLGRVCEMVEALMKATTSTQRNCGELGSEFQVQWIFPTELPFRRPSCLAGIAIRSSKRFSSGFPLRMWLWITTSM